jgi:hypothetical protein
MAALSGGVRQLKVSQSHCASNIPARHAYHAYRGILTKAESVGSSSERKSVENKTSTTVRQIATLDAYCEKGVPVQILRAPHHNFMKQDKVWVSL